MVGPRDGTDKAMLGDTREGTWCPLSGPRDGMDDLHPFLNSEGRGEIPECGILQVAVNYNSSYNTSVHIQLF